MGRVGYSAAPAPADSARSAAHATLRAFIPSMTLLPRSLCTSGATDKHRWTQMEQEQELATESHGKHGQNGTPGIFLFRPLVIRYLLSACFRALPCVSVAEMI